MNEEQIQNCLYWYLQQKHEMLCPNIFLYNWESDFISVTKAGYVHEYEIKTSKQDFKNDRLHKPEKFKILEEGYLLTESEWEKKKYGEKRPYSRPSCFWYVCPQDLIVTTDIADYCGLMYVNDKDRFNTITIIKEPKKVCKDKITPELEHTMLRSLYFRYWVLRNRLVALGKEKQCEN